MSKAENTTVKAVAGASGPPLTTAEEARIIALEYADFYRSKAVGEARPHFLRLADQFQNIADRLAR